MGDGQVESKAGGTANGVFGVVFCLAMALLAFGWVLSADYVPAYRASRAQLRETPASLDSIRVREERTSEGGLRYRLEVNYTYHLDGVEYTGDRLGFGETKWDGDQQTQERRRDEASSREPFFVFVDARDPSRSMLFDDTSGIITWRTWLITAIGVFWLLFGAGALIGLVQEVKERRAQQGIAPSDSFG